MAEKENLSFFDKMLSSNRSALDELLGRGAIHESNQPAQLSNKKPSGPPPPVSAGERHDEGSNQLVDKPLSQSTPANGSKARLKAKSGNLSFSFRSG